MTSSVDVALAKSLFFTQVAFAVHLGQAEPYILPGDLSNAVGMSDARGKEFALGRACAYEALSRFNSRPLAIGTGDGGMPLWPERFCGSIAHTDGLACAAVCPVGEIVGLGVDVERIRNFEVDCARLVCREEELKSLSKIGVHETLPGALIAFVAKEATYKAVYPTLRRFLEFHEVLLSFSRSDSFGGGQFELVELIANGERGEFKVRGRWVQYCDFILAGAELQVAL
jgi:4'-phosphopantetheinyl transferase EntD